MNFPRSRLLTCAGREIHFMEWGYPGRNAVIIWHGITGTCHDHEELAARLADHYYVICPDSLGCGISEWPTDPIQDVTMSFQALIAQDLLTQLGIDSVRWVGASRGGSLGIFIAAKSPDVTVSHLILNDVGPKLADEFRFQLASSLARLPVFDSMIELESFLRKSHARDGLKLNEQKWRRLCETWSRRRDDGKYTLHYSPALKNQVLHASQDFDMWALYDAVNAKTLLILGESSEILSEQDVYDMGSRGPKCDVHVRSAGHLDFFHMSREQEIVLSFLAD